MSFIIDGTSGATFPDSTTQSTASNYVMQVFTAPGTWTKPDGLKSIRVTVVGAGGGSQLNSPATPVTYGGGGGGGAAIKYLNASTIPGPVSVTVGTGSTGTGNSSSFGSFASATGGETGVPGNSSSGGVGSGGDLNITGGGGGNTNSPGGSSILGGGAGAPGGAKKNGGSFGGGASGAPTVNASSATGADGVVIVEEFY